MKKLKFNFDYHTLENYLRRAGITTGYQEKPCLDPKDPECPVTAPNKNASSMPDVGAELTRGCYGFAAKYMHWPEDLLVGGLVKNKTGHIRQAKALQTVVQLMGAHEMYEFWSDTYKVHHIGWTPEKAALVLEYWQKKFSQEVRRLMSQRNVTSAMYRFDAFSTATLNDVLRQHTRLSPLWLGVGLAAAFAYSWLADSGLAALGALLLAGASAAGLGLCSVLGFPMNVLSVHVLPYLSVGIALRDVYLLLDTYRRCGRTDHVLQRSGLTVLMSGLVHALIFCTAAIIPVPALRIFALQVSSHMYIYISFSRSF